MEANSSSTWLGLRRWRVLVAATAGVVLAVYAMLPAARADSSNPPSAPSQRPAPATPVVTAHVTDHGVEVSWSQAPGNAATFNVLRDSSATPLNPQPVNGETWLDRSVQAGSTYTYTATVAAVEGGNQPASSQPQLSAPQGVAVATVGETLGTVTVSVPATFTTSQVPNGNLTESEIPTTLPTWPAVLGTLSANHPKAPSFQVPSAKLPAAGACTESGVLAVALTTWATSALCPVFEITGNLTIPANDTLNISPGTTVFVDPGISITVQGTLDVNGTSTSPVTITSTNAASDSLTPPAPGDWGAILFEPDSTQTQSAVDYADISFGTGILSESHAVDGPIPPPTVPPAFTGGTITNNLGLEGLFSPGIMYVDPSGPISIQGLSYNGPGEGDGVLAISDAPLSLDVANSSFTSALPFAAASLGNGAGITTDITNNNFTTTSNLPALALVSLGASAEPGPGSSILTGTLSGNSLNGSPSLAGLLLISAATGTVAPAGSPPATPSCASGFYAACDDLTMAGNTVTAEGLGVLELTAATAGGNALTDNGVSGGSYLSSDHSGWIAVDWALSSGEGDSLQPSGDAQLLSQFSNTTLTGGGAGLVTRARSTNGSATSSPQISGTSVTGGVGENGFLPEAVNNVAYGSVPTGVTSPRGSCDGSIGTGSATASPVLTGDTLTSLGTSVFNAPLSCGGAATADPQITDTSMTVSKERPEGEFPYGGEGLANYAFTNAASPAEASPTLSGVSITTPSDNIDNYAFSDQGPATADPMVQGSANHARSTLISGNDDGIDNYVDAAYDVGPADAKADPTIVNTDITSADNAIDNGSETCYYADCASAANADASPTITNTTAVSEYDALYSAARPSGGGTGTTSPVISGSTLTVNNEGEAIDLRPNDYEDNNGAATVAGSITGTKLTGESDGIYVDAATDGTGSPVTFSTALSNVSVTSDYGRGLGAYLYTQGSPIQNDPTWAGGSITAPHSYGISLWTNGYGSSASDVIETAPQISGVTVSSYDTGIRLRASDLEAEYRNWPGTVHVGGSIQGGSVTSLDGSGIEARAYCHSCNNSVDRPKAQQPAPAPGALLDTSVTGTTASAFDSAGDFEAYSDGSQGAATVASAVNAGSPGVPGAWQSQDSTAFFSSVYAEGDGQPAESDLNLSNMHASGENFGGDAADIANYVYSDSGAAVDNANFTGNVLDNLWHSADVPAFAEGVTGSTTASRTGAISGNQVSDMLGGSSECVVKAQKPCDNPGGTGLYEYIGGPSELPKLTISDNSVSNVGAKGIWVQTRGNSPSSSVYGAHVLGNTVNFTGEEGILLQGLNSDVEGNTQSNAGLAGLAETVHPSGLSVSGQPGTGLVSCNAFSGNTQGVQFSGNNTDPVTNWNSFVGSNGSTNLTFNLVTDNDGDTAPTNAESNWWGTTDVPTLTAELSDLNGVANIDATLPLSSSPLALGGHCNPGGGGGGGGGGGAAPTGGGGGGQELLPCPNVNPVGNAPNGTTPLLITVAVPGGTSCDGVGFTSNNGGTSPTGFNVLGFGAVITAPQASSGSPLVLTFSFPESSLPPGTTAADVVVFRDGSPVAPCAPPSPATTANPDPCEASVTVQNGVVTITVLSSHASNWSLATPSTAGASRLAGADREGTSLAVSQASFANGGAGAVVLAEVGAYPDALAGVPLAVAKNAPILLTSPGSLDPAVAAEIQRVLPAGGTVYLLGGTSALSGQVASQVAALGYTVTRYGGADRYSTAVAIASALGQLKQIFLVDGTNYPDALSASAAVGSGGTAVVLSNGKSLPASTGAFLKANPVSVFAIGGPAAGADPAATALAGADRYATAILVAQHFFSAPTAVGIATGLNYPDALTAGPRLARLGMPLLLSDPSTLPASVTAYLASSKASVKGIEVYGGTAAVSQAVQLAALAAIGA